MHAFTVLALLPTLSLAMPTLHPRAVNATAPQNTSAPQDTPRGPADSGANDRQLIQSLLLAPKAVDRIALLPQDSDFKFDFLNPPANSSADGGKGGRAVSADRVSFPALIGTSSAMTMGFLGPCGFNTPHIHPRSAELTVLVQGRLATQFVLENKSRTVSNVLLPMQMTLFPMGSLHTQFNPDCDPAVFVASFANEDPGVQQEAQAFFGLDEQIVRAAVGNDFAFEGKDVARFREMIPTNVALGVEACLKKCNIPISSED